MLEDRQQGHEHGHAGEGATAVPEDHERQHGERLREPLVEGMEPTGGHPVHRLDAVVHGMEAPEERDRVREAVTPVVADEDERRREPDGYRRRDEPDDVQVAHPEDRDQRDNDEGDPQCRREQVVDEQMREVGEQAAPEHLLGPEREQLLERNEEEEQRRDADDGAAPHHERHDEGADEREPCDEAEPGRTILRDGCHALLPPVGGLLLSTATSSGPAVASVRVR